MSTGMQEHLGDIHGPDDALSVFTAGLLTAGLALARDLVWTILLLVSSPCVVQTGRPV